MPAAEGITVLGLISSVIPIIETSRDIYDATSSAEELHETFRAVYQNIPLVLNILRDCKKILDQVEKEYNLTVDGHLKRDIDESKKAVEPLIMACEENAKQLQDISQESFPGDDASWVERYKEAARAVLHGKEHKVEDFASAPQLCFPGMRRISKNHPNCSVLHTWNASHPPNFHLWSCGCRYGTCYALLSAGVCRNTLKTLF
jgi:hypothetical protein